MKIKCNDKEIFEITSTDRILLEHDLQEVDAEIERRLEWVIKHKAEQCYKRMHDEWMEKFCNDPKVESIPASKEGFVAMVKARPEYMNRVERDAEDIRIEQERIETERLAKERANA